MRIVINSLFKEQDMPMDDINAKYVECVFVGVNFKKMQPGTKFIRCAFDNCTGDEELKGDYSDCKFINMETVV